MQLKDEEHLITGENGRKTKFEKLSNGHVTKGKETPGFQIWLQILIWGLSLAGN